MSITDYRSKKYKDLQIMTQDLKKEISKSVESVFQQKEKDVHKPRKMRKDLARMLTVLKEKEILEDK